MSRKSKEGVKALNIRIPAKLYDMYAKLCIDEGITKTEGIIRYFEYLAKMHNWNRRALNEQSKQNFSISDGEPE